MNVVYASNEKYVKHMAASMVSLFEKNKREKHLAVYVLSIGITKRSRKLLEDMAGQYGREICWRELGNIREQFDFGVDTRGFDISAMGRLFVGRLLPENVKRALYLDCDTVIAQPLGKLWRMDLRGNILGAVREPTIYQAVKQEIGLGEQDAYVNSGVLLIDLKRWRESGAEGRLLDFYREKNGSLFACDQDTINGALKGEIFFLPPQYNFFTNYRYFSYRELVRCSRTYQAVGKKAFMQAKKHPAVIHYAGDERPWIAGNRNHYRRAYELALARTPWAGQPKEEGRRWYMLAYHGMNYATVVCPPVRRLISRNFGMKAIEARRQGQEKETDTGRTEAKRTEARGTAARRPEGKENLIKPQIEVLLASFQGAAYIGEQLDSILAQGVPGIRILISDDGSTDGTREILERYQREYPDRIFLKHRVKEGKSAGKGRQIPEPAMNFFWLLSQSEGDYVLLSDQDDVWHTQKAEILLKRMKQTENNGRPALVFSDMEVVDAGLRRLSSSFFAYERSNPDRVAFSEVLVENPVTGGALMMNKALVQMAAKMPDACFMHDWWIALCASCFGEISCVKKPLSLYRQHGGNVLGARKTDGLKALQERSRRGRQVEENYRQMFLQAMAFERMYGEEMGHAKRVVLEEFLRLPKKTPAGRLGSIVKNRFYKSSLLQTLAQSITIPRLKSFKEQRTERAIDED